MLGQPGPERLPRPASASGSRLAVIALRSVAHQHQRDLLAHDAAVAGDESPVAVGNLRCAGAAHDLTCAVDNVMHAAGHARLAERKLAAGGIEREVAAIGQVCWLTHGHAAPLPQNPASSRLIRTVIV